MTKYAQEHTVGQLRIGPESTANFRFGRPMPGLIDARIRSAIETHGVSGERPAGFASIAAMPNVLNRVTNLSWANAGLDVSDPVAPGGPRDPVIPPAFEYPATDFDVAILDASATVASQGPGSTAHEIVSDPRSAPVAALGGFAPFWTVQVTNPHRVAVYVTLDVSFTGHRPIRLEDVDLEFLNDKLDQFINDIGEPAVRIVFENKDHEIVIPGQRIGQEPETRIVQHTHVRVVPATAIAERFSELAVDHDLGTRILDQTTQSISFNLSATVFDGDLALKVSLGFPDRQGIIDLLQVAKMLTGAGGDFVSDVVDVFTEIDLRIMRLAINVFVVLRPGVGADPARFEFVGLPMLELANRDLSTGGISTGTQILATGAVKYALDTIVQQIGPELEEAADNFLGWLLGDRDLELLSGVPALQLEVVGPDPRGPVSLAANDIPLNAIPRPPFSPGNLNKIDHIVVVMMENRSFDHMLGYLSLPLAAGGRGRQDVDGLQPTMSNPRNTRGDRLTVYPLPDTEFDLDPHHGFLHTALQRGNFPYVRNDGTIFDLGPNEGFILSFLDRVQNSGLSMPEQLHAQRMVMGYHTSTTVPVFDELASNFAICDKWFASHPGPTWPNRFIGLTGDLQRGPRGVPLLDNPDIASFDPLEDDTIFDHLSAGGIEWRYYEHDMATLRLFSRYTFDRTNVLRIDDPGDGFFARATAGNLPSVTFIDPDIFALPPDANDDHPPADISNGQMFLQSVVDALVASPNWSKTMMIITYDEHGGFYDHVHHTPATRIDPSNPQVGQFVPLGVQGTSGGLVPVDHYGMRVPTFVISPWVTPGAVSSIEYDHTSILKTIIARFMHQAPPDMGRRVDYAHDLGPVLDQQAWRQGLGPLRTAIRPGSRIARSAIVRQTPAPDDFRRMLSEVKRTYLSKN